MPTNSKVRISQQADEVNNEQAQGVYSQNASGYSSQSNKEVVDEVAGTGDASETSADQSTYNRVETGEEGMISDPHASMSSPPVFSTSSGEAADQESAEASDTETMFESVEGWDESQLTEAGEEAEPTIEAYYAEAQGEEFFPALGALIAPLLKIVVPQIAGAVVQQGAKVLSPRVLSLLDRLRKLGLNPAQAKAVSGMMSGKKTEAFAQGEEAIGTDEAALEAFEQQIEAMEVVIGNDDRVRVKNTKVVPWKRICHLRIRAANGKMFLGSGAFIGPRTILTAGHCVYLHSHGGWARDIVVTPGRDATTEPFNKFTATAFRSVSGWVRNKSRDYDYAAIVLPRTANVSSDIGAFGFAAYPDNELRSKRLNTAGYPGDKPSGTMWFHGRMAKAVLPNTLLYDIDTAGGQSGSAVWVRNRSTGNRIVVGIHTNGAPSGNSATRITKPVFENLRRWRSEGGSTAISATTTTGTGASRRPTEARDEALMSY